MQKMNRELKELNQQLEEMADMRKRGGNERTKPFGQRDP